MFHNLNYSLNKIIKFLLPKHVLLLEVYFPLLHVSTHNPFSIELVIFSHIKQLLTSLHSKQFSAHLMQVLFTLEKYPFGHKYTHCSL